MGYAKDTVKGISWMSLFRVVTRIIAFFRIAVLARLLNPYEFGVFGVASLVLAFFDTLSQTGTGIFLIQEKKDPESYSGSAFIISAIRGSLLAVLLFVTAPFIASYFKIHEVVPLIRLLSAVSVLRGFINPMRIRFTKYLQFRKEFFFSFTVFLVDTMVSVGAVIYLKSPLGLVWGLLVGAFTELIMSYIFISPPQNIRFDNKKIGRILNKGKWYTGYNIFTYFFEQGDDMIVGKVLGAGPLGIYQAGYKLSTLPITEIVGVFNQVTLPVYINIREELPRLKKAFLKTTFAVAVLTLPLCLFLYVFSAEITYLVLGSNWIAVVPILKLLSVFGFIRAIIVSTTPVFNAIKRQDIIAKTSFFNLVLMVLMIIPFIYRFGLQGAPYAVIASSFATLPLIYYYLVRIFKI